MGSKSCIEVLRLVHGSCSIIWMITGFPRMTALFLFFKKWPHSHPTAIQCPPFDKPKIDCNRNANIINLELFEEETFSVAVKEVFPKIASEVIRRRHCKERKPRVNIKDKDLVDFLSGLKQINLRQCVDRQLSRIISFLFESLPIVHGDDFDTCRNNWYDFEICEWGSIPRNRSSRWPPSDHFDYGARNNAMFVCINMMFQCQISALRSVASRILHIWTTTTGGTEQKKYAGVPSSMWEGGREREKIYCNNHQKLNFSK